MIKLKIENLNYSINNKKIIENINLKIKEKSFVGLIGPNGCGKSTLLKNIYKVLTPSNGKIYIEEKNIKNLPSKEFARIVSVVAQNDIIDFDFSIKDIVLMGRYSHKKLFESNKKEDEKIVDEALEIVGLKGYEERSFFSLSGGEKQRVFIARAIVQQSEFIILDEPTNHLDIKYQIQIMNILKSLNKTTFSAIHDMNLAAYYCNYLIIMKDRKIYNMGTPEEVLTEKMFKEVFEVNAKINESEYTKKLNIHYIP